MAARWEQTLDIQMDLWRFWNSPEGESFASGFGESMNVRHRHHVEQGTITDIRTEEEIRQANYWTEHIAKMEKVKMLQGSPFFVSEDVMTILEAAEPMFKPEPLHGEDLICPAGFAWLPRPFTVTDVNGQTIAYRGISWGPIMGDARNPETGELEADRFGILLSLYSYIYDIEDEQRDEIIAAKEKYGGSHTTLMHITPWWYGEEKIFDTPGGVGDMCRQFQVFQKIAMQMVTSREERKAPRPARRRAQKLKMKYDEIITVVTLRRKKPKKDEPDEGSEVNWTHRWIVNGHWRWQWYPSLGVNKQKWISGYVKGPEDKELIIKKRAFEFTR